MKLLLQNRAEYEEKTQAENAFVGLSRRKGKM